MTQPGGLESLLAAGRFVVTAEVTPPLSADAGVLLARAAPLKGKADAVNVTDGAGARATMSSLAAAAILVRAGIEPVLQVACRDRNRIALAADLIGAAALGVTNILALHGDDPEGGDLPDAKPVYDLDSRGVMALARQLREDGTLPSGRAVQPPPRLFIGGADTPFDPPAGWQPTALLAKAEAGADFVQTQFCFDPAVAGRYLARLAEAGLTERLAIILGVGPLASARQARWMNENLHGVSVPEGVIERLERAADPAAEGRKLCVELIQGLSEIPGVAGVHLMAPQQKAEAIARVIEDSGLLKDRPSMAG
ncbi:MAG: methylenetetrahydrofolate reductase [Rhodospirillales bacterium]|nr:methylenetetrahydrofolate reductase [Rhodospirillales bacterium]MDH3918839.1 methylenetetrahydrofolate reductase [Rhodospirillales bacterium]MDH3968849.1 methylenetetrahydrofolate reductase [Rhodospirillales bacterium]